MPVTSVLMAISVQTFNVNEKLTPCKKRKVACTKTGCSDQKQGKNSSKGVYGTAFKSPNIQKLEAKAE